MKREKGFTIVEVIVAILVLTIGLLGLVTSAALVTRMIGRGQRSAVAAQDSQRRLRRLRGRGRQSRGAGAGSGVSEPGGGERSVVEGWDAGRLDQLALHEHAGGSRQSLAGGGAEQVSD